MIAWHAFIDETAIASVLPSEYARFAKPVSEALSVFLKGLPTERQAAVMAAQTALPLSATIPQRLAKLAACCPVLHKLGQVLARDRRLVPDFRRQLQQLESVPPSVSSEQLQRALTAELGSLQQRGARVEPSPIAEASVAVVVGFDTSGRNQLGRGVFKILKPGIEERLEQELQLTERVGDHLDQRCGELQIPQLDYRATFEQVREKLLQEVRLDREQRHLQEASTYYADDPRVQIPDLFSEFCTPRVTAMRRVSGGKVTDQVATCPSKRREVAETVVQALISRPIFSRDPRAMFHCDPHAGNLFLTDEGRLAILDWSLVGRLSNEERATIVQIFLGAMSFDVEQILRQLTALADRPPDLTSLRRVTEESLRQIRQGRLPALQWLVELLDEAVQSGGLRIAGDLLLFRKALFTLEGVLRDLSPTGGHVDRVLAVRFLKNFIVEWPERWIAAPNSREFSTRLSNVDLTRWWFGLPLTTARLGTAALHDWLHTTPSCTTQNDS